MTALGITVPIGACARPHTPTPSPTGTGTDWAENPGEDGRYWKLPQQATSVVDMTSTSAQIVRNGVNGSGGPNSSIHASINRAGNFATPFYIGASTDAPVTVTDGGSESFQVRLPVGAVPEAPFGSSTDSSIGGADRSHPGLIWSAGAVTLKTNGVADTQVRASGTVITAGYGIQRDWAFGPFMEDAVTGQPGYGNSYGIIQDIELTRVLASSSYVVPHMLQVQMDETMCNTSIVWPLAASDPGVTGGPLSQGLTLIIPRGTTRPGGITRGQGVLFDVMRNFGALVYNFGNFGGVGSGGVNFIMYSTSTDPAIVALANDIAANVNWVMQFVGILTGQTGHATAKGKIGGVRSDAFPAPPTLDIRPLPGGVEVSSSTVGAYYQSSTAGFSSGSGGYTATAPT